MSETHPVQIARFSREQARLSTKVTLRAYEVYCHVWSPQEKMITGECRGGFSAGEIIAFLYAYPFPKEEWTKRFHEACEGMVGL